MVGLQAQKSEILDVAGRVFNLPGLKKIMEKLDRKPLRFGFEKIKGKRDQGSLKVALLLLKGYHDDEKRRLFFLWKLCTDKGRHDEQIEALSKRPHIIDGATRLADVLSRGPRAAMRNLQKNSNNTTRQKDLLKRFKQLFLRGVSSAFQNWLKNAEISSALSDLAKLNRKLDALHPLHLLFNLKPLRFAFSKLK